MSLSMHSASVPTLVKMLDNMLGWLDKAEAHAAARQFDSANYLGLRLAPDMLPFVKQVQIASDTAKGCAARLAEVEVPKWSDDEATLDALRERLRKTIEFVQALPAERFEGADARAIVLPLRGREPLRASGAAYLQHFVLPNFYFHCTTAYALLRHAGVALGKMDYLGPFGR